MGWWVVPCFLKGSLTVASPLVLGEGHIGNVARDIGSEQDGVVCKCRSDNAHSNENRPLCVAVLLCLPRGYACSFCSGVTSVLSGSINLYMWATQALRATYHLYICMYLSLPMPGD